MIKKAITIFGVLIVAGMVLIVAGYALHMLLFLWAIWPRTYGPYSLEEARNREIFHPLYHPSAETESLVGSLELTYYLYVELGEGEIDVYFTNPGEGDQPERVARMLTYHARSAGATIYQSKVPIRWAYGSFGKRCAPSVEYNPDKITGLPYQTCITWSGFFDGPYVLYTIWPEEKTLQFIDSFVKAKPPLESNTSQ